MTIPAEMRWVDRFYFILGRTLADSSRENPLQTSLNKKRLFCLMSLILQVQCGYKASECLLPSFFSSSSSSLFLPIFLPYFSSACPSQGPFLK